MQDSGAGHATGRLSGSVVLDVVDVTFSRQESCATDMSAFSNKARDLLYIPRRNVPAPRAVCAVLGWDTLIPLWVGVNRNLTNA